MAFVVYSRRRERTYFRCRIARPFGGDCFARGEPRLNYLPPGPFELHPLPDGVCDRFTARRKDKFEDKAKDMTPRERKRMRRVYDALG